MKRTVALLSIVILVFAVCSAFAQGSRSGRKPVDFAKFDRIEGFTDGDGAYLRWSMTVETANVGFLVYRVGASGLELASKGLIPGSMTTSGSRTYYGGKYDCFDPQGHLDTAYIIVSQAADGRRISTASFTPRFTNDFLTDTGYTKEFLVQHWQYQGGQINNLSPALTRDLTAQVNASRHAPDPAVQRWTVAQPGVKIAVRQEGMYRVSRAELQTAGFPVDSDSTNWRMFLNGNEQSIIVGDGNQYVDFYGRGIDTFETDTRIYYLINDTVPGRRMVSKVLSSIGGNVVANNYRFNAEKKERLFYDPNVQNGDVENYFGQAIISDPPVTETITLSSIDPQGLDAYLQINLQGLTNTPHSVHILINGVDAGVLTGPSGRVHFGGTFVVPQNLLLEGANSITLTTVASSDTCYFDSIRANYSRRYVVDQNRIPFYTPGYRRANITGFTSPNIRVFDTTLDGDPQLIVNPQIVQDGGTYTVRMPSNRPAVFFAVEDSALLQSPSVTFDSPSSLASPDNVADMIIISYSSPEFMAVAEGWANYRRSSAGGQFNVKVVSIDDVFDEFSYGLHAGNAIADFLLYANTNWQSPKPSYVILIGDASYDRRNYEGYGYWDMVPTKNVSLLYEETGSDDALSDFDHNGLADIPIGRIAARASQNVQTVLNKTMLFETTANQSLNRGALCAFDEPINYDFDAMCHVLMAQLPPTVPTMFVARADPMAHQNLMTAINSGKYVVNYAGHGSAGLWAAPDFFSTVDVPSLTNVNNPSIFTMLTCFNGFFLRPRPTDDSLAEALIKAPNGGAVASWASTTETTPDYQLTMGIPFFHGLGDGSSARLGDLIKASKQSIAGSDVGYSWVLLGDPALKLH